MESGPLITDRMGVWHLMIGLQNHLLPGCPCIWFDAEFLDYSWKLGSFFARSAGVDLHGRLYGVTSDRTLSGHTSRHGLVVDGDQ